MTPKVINVTVKCSDAFYADLLDMKGNSLGSYDGYVPDFFPTFVGQEHYGDYILLSIDLATGQILNWVKPTAEQVEALIKREEEARCN